MMMTQTNNLTQPGRFNPIGKPMLIGAGIALILMSLFLLPIKNTDPEWGPLWMIRPLVVITFAGAAGGVFYYLMKNLRSRGGWGTFAANALSLLVYLIGLWMGTILGLAGTLWN